MLEEVEAKTLECLIQQIREVLYNSNVNPLNGMNLIALAARRVITDIAVNSMLSKDEAIINSLGAMIPKDYIMALMHGDKDKGNGSPMTR